eukprot:333756_1
MLPPNIQLPPLPKTRNFEADDRPSSQMLHAMGLTEPPPPGHLQYGELRTRECPIATNRDPFPNLATMSAISSQSGPAVKSELIDQSNIIPPQKSTSAFKCELCV